MEKPFDDVLDYWFGDQVDGFPVEDRTALWWQGGPEIDEDIRARFAAADKAARNGELDDWVSTPRGCLALVILLDQFSRNLYRGRAEAFSQDQTALAIVNAALTRGWDRDLSWCERSFFYLPFEHAESLVDQERCVALFQAMLEEAPASARGRVEGSLDFAKQHREVIARFGRFPHRNEVLGRVSTHEELDFLGAGANRFGQ